MKLQTYNKKKKNSKKSLPTNYANSHEKGFVKICAICGQAVGNPPDFKNLADL